MFLATVGILVGPCGYSAEETGGALAGLGFAGIFGSFLLVFILTFYKNYLTMQKVLTVLSMAACIWCLGVNQPGNAGVIIAGWIFYGFIVGPLIPITLEHAAEMTYPIPADNSAALLFTGVNMLFLAVTLGVTPLLEDQSAKKCTTIFTRANILMFWFVVAGALICLPMKTIYKRANIKNPADMTDEEKVKHDEEEKEITEL